MSQARRSGNFLLVSSFFAAVRRRRFKHCFGKFPTVSRKLFFSLSFLLISVSHSLFFCVSCLVYCRQSIKSSFRDKDKPSRFKDLQTTTRFQVEPQNEESDDDSHDSQEDRELLNDNEYDTKYGKSFRSV